MQARHFRQVCRLFVMKIPESARQVMHQSHGSFGKFIACRYQRQLIELTIGTHEADIIITKGRLHEFIVQARKARTFFR